MPRLTLTILLLILSPLAKALDLQYLQTELHFTSGQYHLNESQMAQLDKLFPLPDDWVVDDIRITGRADMQGESMDNLTLSQKRAEATYTYLKSQHLDVMTYSLVPLGEEEPLDDQSLAANRLVQVKIKLVKPWSAANEDTIHRLFEEEFPTPKIEVKSTSALGAQWSIEAESTIQLTNVEFHPNSTAYLATSKRALRDLLSFMEEHPDLKIRIDGHTNTGMLSKVYGGRAVRRKFGSLEGLALERAKSIRSYLVEEGVEISRVQVKGWGAQKPLYEQPQNEKEEAANRRIEVVVLSV